MWHLALEQVHEMNENEFLRFYRPRTLRTADRNFQLKKRSNSTHFNEILIEFRSKYAQAVLIIDFQEISEKEAAAMQRQHTPTHSFDRNRYPADGRISIYYRPKGTT